METITISEILKATRGKLICGDTDSIIKGVSINSKEIEQGSLFVAIIGENFDAHKFINSALDNGASAALCSDASFCNNKKTWILVDDTKVALQDLAAYYRTKFDIPVIGVTGSVGKTTTKEIIASALSYSKKVLKTKANLNSQIGLPLTIFGIDKSHDLAVIEMGMSFPDEMKRLAEIAKPTHAVITNIGISHIENLGTQKNILSEKLHISDYIDDAGTLYLNGDDTMLWDVKEKVDINTKTFGLSDKNDIHILKSHFENMETKFSVNVNGQVEEFIINTIGEHNILNALAAIELAIDLGLEVNDIKKGISKFKPLKMRQLIEQLSNGVTLIDDSYNASPDSISSGLSVLSLMETSGKKIAVLADMLELGNYSDEAHFNLGKTAIKFGINNIITIGKQAKQIAYGAKELNPQCNTKSFGNNQEALDYLISILKSEDIVLIKGSRGMKTDEIVAGLKKMFPINL